MMSRVAVTALLLSPDGRLAAFRLEDEKSQRITIVVKPLEGGDERYYDINTHAKDPDNPAIQECFQTMAHQPAFSPSGQWLAFAAQLEDADCAIAIVDSASGERRDFAGAQSFKFIGRSGDEWIVLISDRTDDENTLTIRSLASDRETVLRDVGAVACSPDGRRIAWSSADSLHVFDVETDKSVALDQGDENYSALTWSPTGRMLAALRGKGAKATLLMFGLDKCARAMRAFTQQDLVDFPEQFEIGGGELAWRENETGLFVNIRKVLQTPKAVENPVPNLAIWHWRDHKTPMQRSVAERRPAYLCYLSLQDGRFFRLADETLAVVLPHPFGMHALGFNTRDERGDGCFGIRYDYCTIDLRSGKRAPLVESLVDSGYAAPRFSPSGDIIVFQEGGAYIALELATGARRNMTEDVPARFYFEEDVRKPGAVRTDCQRHVVWQGWSADGEYVLVSDFRDVWALPLRGKQAVNLTGNGQSDNIIYQRAQFSASRAGANFELDLVDLNEPIYFLTTERRTERMGLVRRSPENGAVDVLYTEDAYFDYIKAENADAFLMRQRTSTKDMVYSRVSSSWRPDRILLDTNEFTADQRKSSGMHLAYQTERGEWLRATLYPPFDYEPGKSYPTILKLYELMAEPHSLVFEGSDTHPELGRGYAILLPDIHARNDEIGPAAVEGAMAAVEAAVATGIVDRDRLGVTGHSYGGSETYFIITQTDMFRAAIVSAGVSNHWSRFGSTWGVQEQAFFTWRNFRGRNQARFTGPWWKNLNTYLRNSALYHAPNVRTPLLIVHGDQDEAVRFDEALQMFATLHAMGDRPVALLQYVGTDHSGVLCDPDAAERKMQFYDHFLKDTPAPDWWSEGVSIPAGKAASVSI